MWEQDQTDLPNKSLTGTSDARSDVSQNGRFDFRGRGVVNPNHAIIMNTNTANLISRRQKIAGSNHHLWNNHGTWWFHGTLHLPDGTAERVRVNLKTDDLSKARSRRDFILSGRCVHNSLPFPDASSSRQKKSNQY